MHYKQNNKQTRTYVQGLRPLLNTLPRGVKGILKKNGYNYSEIINKWNLLVGKDISQYCFPKSIKIKKGSKKATLILGVERGNEINIEYSKNLIINKINSYFGYKFINEIRLTNINSKNTKRKENLKILPLKKFEKNISLIKNKDIRNSLYKLLGILAND
jgi:hypothetical protein